MAICTLDNTANPTTLTNYQVKVVLPYLPGMQIDFADLRFTTNDQTTEIPFWLESFTPGIMATFWVKVPSLPGSSYTTIWAFYDNPSATSASNGYAVFDYFEDFTDISDWTTYGGGAYVWTPNAGEMQLYNPGLTRAWTVPTTPVNLGNFVLEMRYAIMNNNGEEGGPLLRIPGSAGNGEIDGYQPALRGRAANDMPVWRMTNMNTGAGGLTDLGSVATGWSVTNAWYCGVLKATGNAMQWYPDMYSHTGTSRSWNDATYPSGNIGLWVYSYSDLRTDWMFARQYTNPEPVMNRYPEAKDNLVTVDEDSSYNAIYPLSNDNDPDGNPIAVYDFSTAQHGFIEWINGGELRYTPDADYYGSDEVRYWIADTWGNWNTAMIWITVDNVQDAPVAEDDSYTVRYNSENNVLPVLENDYDMDDDVLTIFFLYPPMHGTATITDGGTTITYIPSQDYGGPDTFTYAINDGNGGIDTAVVDIDVTGKPVPISGSHTVYEEEQPPLADGPSESDATTNVIVVDVILLAVMFVLLVAVFRKRESDD